MAEGDSWLDTTSSYCGRSWNIQWRYVRLFGVLGVPNDELMIKGVWSHGIPEVLSLAWAAWSFELHISQLSLT
jgi:hypothetical protein